MLLPLVVPVKVPPPAGIAIGDEHPPEPGSVVVVVVLLALGGVTLSGKLPLDVEYPSTMMKYVCPAVTVGVRREARTRPVELVHASSLQPPGSSLPVAHGLLRM